MRVDPHPARPPRRWNQAIAAALLLLQAMLVLCHACVSATPPRACFAASRSVWNDAGGRARRAVARRARTLAAPQRRPPPARALQGVSCHLRTCFPHGLLAPLAGGARGGVGDGAGTRRTGADGTGGAACVLDENTVHVWMVQTGAIEGRGEAFMETLRETLSEDERQRYARSMATPKAREQALSFLVARALLRSTLSRYCPQVAPSCWRFEVNVHGRPSLCSQLQEELSRDKSNAALRDILQHLAKLRFNLSHCAGMVVCAFAYGREVGIDSEHVNARRRITSIAKRFFTPAESAALLSLPEEAHALTFSRLWTLKEAYVKARGLGIAEIGLDNFEFQHVEALSQERPTGALAVDLSKAGDAASSWQFVVLDPPRACVPDAGGGGGNDEAARGGASEHVRGGGGGDGEGGPGGRGRRGARHAIALATSCADMQPAEVRVCVVTAMWLPFFSPKTLVRTTKY